MELKPCPFCGGKADFKLVEVDEPVTFFDLFYCVRCSDCGFQFGYAHISRLPQFCEDEVRQAKSILEKKWNRRAE